MVLRKGILILALLALCPLVSAEGNATQCGVINTSITLEQDVDSTGTCYTVNASNIIIDGAGYSLYGDGTGNAIAIIGVSNVTVKNAVILNFSTSINITNTTDVWVENLTIFGRDQSGRVGVAIDSSYDAVVFGSTIHTPGSTSVGVRTYRSERTVVANCTITNFSSGGGGIFNDLGSNLTWVENNTFTGAQVDYFFRNYNGNAHTIQHNTFTATEYANTGFDISSGYSHRFRWNTFTMQDSEVISGSQTHNLTIEGNNITLTTAQPYNIVGLYGVTNTTFNGNTLVSDGLGILVASSGGHSKNITFRNNDIRSHRNNGYGVQITSSGTDPMQVIENNITVNGTRSNAIDISYVANATVTNNNLTSTHGYAIITTGDSPGMVFEYNTSTASVRWTGSNITVNRTIGVSNGLYLSAGIAAVDISAFAPGTLNSTANITFFGLNYTNVTQIYRYPAFTTAAITVLENGTLCDDCGILSYNASSGVARINVSGFSTYAINGTYASVAEQAAEDTPERSSGSGGGGGGRRLLRTRRSSVRKEVSDRSPGSAPTISPSADDSTPSASRTSHLTACGSPSAPTRSTCSSSEANAKRSTSMRTGRMTSR